MHAWYVTTISITKTISTLILDSMIVRVIGYSTSCRPYSMENLTRMENYYRGQNTIVFMSFIFILCASVVVVSTARVHQNSVLVFGGNGFIGSESVIKLLENGDRVTIVNRGNWYWDSSKRVKPFVRHIKCDRMQTLNQCEEFVQFIEGEGELVFFDAVVDFSGYHPFAVRDAMRLLGKRFGLYIYIGTDSVYDICARKTHSGPTREDDAITATNPDDVSPNEEYGEQKFECEKVLEQSLAVGGPPFITLRLPDVIGPRDNTKRWWIYQLWIKLDSYVDKHIAVPTKLEHSPLSFVYVSDVADIVSKLIKADPSLHNQAYNIAFRETITLASLLDEIKQNLNMSHVQIPTSSDNTTIYMFPSVRRGPVDISKALKYLGWSPTPLKTAIAKTVQFYEDAISNPDYMIPRTEIIQDLVGYISDDPRGREIAEGVFQEYGVDLYKAKDEL